MKRENGFTLVELITAMAVTMILLVAVYMAVNSVQRHSSAIERKVTAQQDVKPALDLMAMEIGMASYNPTFATNLWVNPPGSAAGTCGSSTGANQTYRGIQEATATSIAVEMDISGPAAGSASDGFLGDANETIRYNYVTGTANEYITRSTNCAGGNQAFLGDVSGNTRAVRVINDTLGLPMFRYYNGSGTEIAVSGADLGGLITDIRRIEITLAVETEDIDPNTGQRRRLIYSTSVIPRNHATISTN
ncbi:MAG: prepilin-type N-terminal cleavage/methylation domain-containing protein [Syntrophales bacterium]|jgi:prepilin-type N-terminal cleavage/methylation domain-containing protein|nr:prepilin-type N-terminal cleavage/methylation domain-containing protein [Syntrophales bacterium]